MRRSCSSKASAGYAQRSARATPPPPRPPRHPTQGHPGRQLQPVSDRYLQPGETRRRPLKGRGRRVTRTIPIPNKVAATLRDHLARFTATGGDALVFVNTIGGRIDLSNFHRDVWKHAVAATFPTGPLRHVRRQDLRHAAITLWLNSVVPLKVAQTWSGHKTLSMLLDTYLGVRRHATRRTRRLPTRRRRPRPTTLTRGPRAAHARQAWHTHGTPD
ncbi:MAG TPA: tyrosine-type recombinase/integrase [Euzebyales bacterium]|nr:tyrosine-type recombinase/integrase [Euzebyales bacterium]